METTAITSGSDAAGTEANKAAAALGGDDFFSLLITQLTNQDPLDPMSNQELLDQLSSIRQIELTTSLTDSLKTLTEQQRFASASLLIDKYVTGAADATGESGQPISGVVAAVRFDAAGKAILQLQDGSELPLEQLGSVMDAQQWARQLVGRTVRGVDRTDSTGAQEVAGVVTGSTVDSTGQIRLQLSNGHAVLLSDVLELGSSTTETASAAGSAA